MGRIKRHVVGLAELADEKKNYGAVVVVVALKVVTEVTERLVLVVS